MAQTMLFTIGADASCSDGACGQVSRVIVNPVAREVTHLVVDPKYRHNSGRLVPVDLVDATTGQIRLRCTLAELQTLQPAEKTESVTNLGSDRAPGRGHPMPGPRQVTVDCVPSGEVDVRPGLTVCATDGEIGQVHGLVVEPGGHRVTHVLLKEGHIWGHKEVAIPISAVTKIGTMLIHPSITKHQVETLPTRGH